MQCRQIPRNFHRIHLENCELALKNSETCEILEESAERRKTFFSEFGAVQRKANLVDLEKIMLKIAPTLAIVAVHTDENEPFRVQIRLDSKK